MSLRRRILLSSETNGQRLSAPPPPSPSHQLPSHVIIVVASVTAASVFLAIVYYAVLRRRRRRHPLSVGRLSSGHDTSSTSSDDSDHPIWHIKTVGLDDSAIESIGSYAHLGGAAADCSVCLGELLDGDTVRLLPQCSHVFHVQCIDTWLRSHVSCPLCRAALVVAPPAASAGADVEGPPAVDDPQLNEEVAARVSVENSQEVPECSETATGASRSISMDAATIGGILFRVDEEKDGNCSNCKEEGSEKGHSESGRGFLFSRLGRARSSSLLPL